MKYDVPAEKQVVDLLKAKGWHISFAESCTGGLAAATLVSVADASWVLEASAVTYSAEAKAKYAGVSLDTVARYNVVSEEVAREMAAGIARNNGAEVGVGVTGIAGPGGGDELRPVGTVCFGFSVDGAVTTCTRHFGALGRNQVRQAAVDFVFETLLTLLR